MNNEIIFDEKSGISAEEQKEILSQINGIAEKNRQMLSENLPEKITGKKGALFPLVVNISAAAILCIGAAFLISFNTRVDEGVRTGNVVFNLTERALIDEIRKDTAEQIAAKEMEIASITSRMEDIDNELLQLYSSNITLSAEQLEVRERLVQMQGVFREELSVLNTERSQILETSRAREARLRAQLEERTREYAAAAEKAGELDSALGELQRLSGEQERFAAIDAHFAGSIASIGDMIQNERYDQAANAITAVREFVNSSIPGSSAASRSFSSRREYYNQTINMMEAMIHDARRNSGTVNNTQQLEMLAKNAELQETVNNMQKTIDSFTAGSSGQTQRISELEASAATMRDQVSALRTANSALEQSSSDKDRTITNLQNENRTLSSSTAELRATITTQEQRITELNNNLTAIRQLLTEN